MNIPSLSTQQMIEVDRLMIEEYEIQLIQMMENAGRNLAELSRRKLGGDVGSRQIAVLCGAGNNGGGGMVAARHLANWGAEVVVKVFAERERIKDIPAHQLKILEVMGIAIKDEINLEVSALIIDAMIGYGLTGNPQGPIADWINMVNDSERLVLSLDTPSGLDTTSGNPGNPCIVATATMTLALPKTGLLVTEARPFTGELFLADISVPPQLYVEMGIDVPPIFTNDTIIKI